MRAFFVLLTLVLGGGWAVTQPAQPAPAAADLVVVNARVYTVDQARPRAQAVAVRGDRNVLVGTDAEVLATKGPGTQVIDVGGRAVVPGLHDAHGHVLRLGQSLQHVNLRGTGSAQAVVDAVRARARTVPSGTWVVGRGWDQNDWADTARPTAAQLDAAVATMVHDAGVEWDDAALYRRVVDDGQAKTRLYVMLRPPRAGATLPPPLPGHAGHQLTVRAVKLVADGALGSRGAALHEPYSDEAATRGLLVTSPAELHAQALAAVRAGAAYAAHLEHELGMLRPGLLADLLVLSDDIMEVEPARILAARPVITVRGGRVTFRHGL